MENHLKLLQRQNVITKIYPHPIAQFSGKTKIAFCNRLGENWKLLADYLEITPAEQSRFTHFYLDQPRSKRFVLGSLHQPREKPCGWDKISRPKEL